MKTPSNYEKCLTSKLVRYDWSQCWTSRRRWKNKARGETLTMKRSLLHICEVHFIHQWIVVIRLISCCLFLHFHAWSTVYHLQSRVNFIAPMFVSSFSLSLSFSTLHKEGAEIKENYWFNYTIRVPLSAFFIYTCTLFVWAWKVGK